jgi:hypothetical protein
MTLYLLKPSYDLLGAGASWVGPAQYSSHRGDKNAHPA